MSMSPVGDNLKIQCRQFPALVNCCTIDWFENWEGSALESVACRLLEEKKLEGLDEISRCTRVFHEEATKIAEAFQNQMKRKFFITPKTCLDNIALYSKQLDLKSTELD